jgi:hypothetical protein
MEKYSWQEAAGSGQKSEDGGERIAGSGRQAAGS